MDNFDDIQIEESSYYEYGEFLSEVSDDDDKSERHFFEYLNSNFDN